VFVIALQFVVLPPAALATTCTVINGSATIDIQNADLTVTRNATQLTANGIPCDLLTKIDTVHINMQSSDLALTFDLSNGVLGPGMANEGDGSSEIEFDITNPSSDYIAVFGGTGPTS
jgi:hypothetical protein